MSPLTILRYLTGNADAIRQVASRPAALGIAIVLVILTGVARNYDQLLFTETLRWLYGPLLFSAFSGFWLWLFVMRAWGGYDKTAPNASVWLRLRSFYSVFWMTAPIASCRWSAGSLRRTQHVRMWRCWPLFPCGESC